MQTTSLMDILSPQAGQGSSQGASNLLGAGESSEFMNIFELLQGGGENILAMIQKVFGLGEDDAEKVTELLEIFANLEEGDSVQDLLDDLGMEKITELKKFFGSSLDEIVFDGKNFADKSGKTFSVDNVFDKITNKLESIVKNLPKNLKEIFRNTDVMSQITKIGNNGHSKLSEVKVSQSGDDFVRNMKMFNKSTVIHGNDGQISTSRINSKLNAYNKEQNLLNDGLLSNKFINSEMNTNPEVMSQFEALMPKVTQTSVAGNTQVLDLNNITANNQAELIDQISAHIETNRLANTDKLDLVIKHDELGHFKMNVEKGAADQIDMKIVTGTNEGHKFFMDNQGDLMKSLNKAGLKLGEFKLSNSNESGFKNESSMSGESGQRQFSSQHDGSENADSKRRRALWQEYKERYAA